MEFLKKFLPLESLNEWFKSISLNDVYVQHTLYAFAVLVIGFLGYILGQRLTSNGKLCLVIGLAVGSISVALFFTSYGYFAPGICGVFLITFLASGLVARLAQAGANKGGGEK